MFITWQNGEVYETNTQDIFVQFWCEDVLSWTETCVHWTYLLSTTKDEISEIWTSALFYSWIMLSLIFVVLFVLKWIFYKFFK